MFDCSDIIEYDLNPFFEFDKNGKILNANLEAEFLLSKIDKKTLFELAINNAPMNFGFVNKYLDFKFYRTNFYGLTVGYRSVDSIILRLYKVVSSKKLVSNEFNQLVNIYEIVDLAISSTMISNINLKIKRLFDPTIPNLKINTNKFLLILNKVLENFISYNEISISINLKIGEYIKIDDKKYQVIKVKVESQNRDKTNDTLIENLSSKLSVYPIFLENSISLELPLIE
jgi:hypothetical protein